jgi:hypothetical protein
MMVTYKLNLFGHVHGRPHQKITSFYTSPKGFKPSDIAKLVWAFDKAFVLLEVEQACRKRT